MTLKAQFESSHHKSVSSVESKRRVKCANQVCKPRFKQCSICTAPPRCRSPAGKDQVHPREYIRSFHQTRHYSIWSFYQSPKVRYHPREYGHLTEHDTTQYGHCTNQPHLIPHLARKSSRCNSAQLAAPHPHGGATLRSST